MKVELISLNEDSLENRDYKNIMIIRINGERKFKVIDGELEDSNLTRDFVDCWSIPSLMEIANEAGQNGKQLEIEYKKVSLDEIFEDIL